MLTMFLAGLLAVAGAAAYEIGPRDVLDIRVYDEPDLSKEAVVAGDGTVTVPLLGSVAVSGLTTEQAEMLLRRRLGEKYLVNPQVFVSVKEYNARRVVVLGSVKNPGPYALTGETRLVDLISRAGGVVAEGGKNIVLVRALTARPASAPVTAAAPVTSAAPIVIDAMRLLRHGDHALNYVVNAGDMVFVPKSDGVYVYGQVKKPGVVPYRDGLTVLQAVSLAEGLTTGADADSVRVIRSDRGREKTLQVNLDAVADNKAADVRLKPEDIVVVPESFF